MFIIANQSNVREGEFSIDLTSPVVKEKKVKEPKEIKEKKIPVDLYFKDDKFTINNKFLKDQVKGQGWGAGYDKESNTALIYQTKVDSDTKSIFLKSRGQKTLTNRFESDALKYFITQVGLDFTLPFYLTLSEDTDKYTAYSISNTAPVISENSGTIVDTHVDTEEISIANVETLAPIQTTEQVEQFAQTGVEELPQINDPEYQASQLVEDNSDLL